MNFRSARRHIRFRLKDGSCGSSRRCALYPETGLGSRIYRYTPCICRKLNPNILMVQTTKNWCRQNASDDLNGPWDWRIFLQG